MIGSVPSGSIKQRSDVSEDFVTYVIDNFL